MPRHGPGLGAGSFPAANKLLLRYEMDRAQKIHQQKVNCMRHRLDVKEPKRHNHLILRLKQIQKEEERQAEIDHENNFYLINIHEKEEERQAEIDHENKLLLAKMTHVMKYGGNIDNWNNYESRSLNYPAREKQSEDIARENLGIARRLETVRPQLKIHSWERDYQKHAYLKRLWSDSVKDFGDFTPRRYRSRMSKARSLETSLDDDDDYESVAQSEDKRLPKLDRARKQNLRATQSETGAPVSSRRDEPPPKAKPAATKLPKIVPHKALIEHDYSMYYGSVSSLNKLPLDSERSTRPSKLDEMEDESIESILDDSPYQSKPRDSKDRSGEQRERPDRKPDTDRDKHRKPKLSDRSNNRTRRHGDRAGDEQDADRDNDEHGRNLHANSQSSFQSAVLPTNDMERVQTLISEEKDKDFDNQSNENAQKTDKDESRNHASDNDKNTRKDTRSEKEDGGKSLHEDNNKNADDKGDVERNADAVQQKQTTDSTEREKKEKHKEESTAKDAVTDSKTTESADSSDKDTDNQVVVKESEASASKDKEAGSKDGGKKRKQKADGTSGAGTKEDDASDVAQLFKIAKQLGKPEEIFIKTLIKKSHKQRMKTKAKFREKYDLDLIKELKNGLGQPWERLIDALLQERGDSDSYNLFDALSKRGGMKTDDMCDVVELLCSRDNAALADLKESYRKEFSVSLEEDIMDRTDPPVQTLLLALQKGCRDESSAVDMEAARKDALNLHESGSGRWEDDNGMFVKLLNGRSFGHMQAVFGEYKSVSEGQSILAAMKADCSKEYYPVLSTVVHCIGSPASYFAERIHKHRLPTDQAFIDILVTRSEIDMPSIRKVYKKNFGLDVVEEIKSKQHPTQKCLIELACKAPSTSKGGGDSKQQKGAHKGGAAPQQQPQQSTHKKPPPAPSKKADSVKGKPDSESADPVAKPRAQQESKSKQDNPAVGGQSKKKDEAHAAAKKPAQKKDKDEGPSKEKKDGDHNGTVRPAANFRPEDDAERLNKAMSGMGTDEAEIVAIVPRRSNKQRQKLKQVYEQKLKKNLMIDLESELTGDTEEIVLALMMTKPEYDAYILHEAVEGLGTSEATLVGILGSRSAQEMKAIREHYKKSYKVELELDVTRDTDGHLKELFGRLCGGERQEEAPVNAAQAKKDAQDLYKDGEAAVDPSSKVFQDLLVCRHHYQVKATFQEYKKLAGHDVYAGLTKAGLADDEETYISITKSVEDPVTFHAEKLISCFNNMGTNDNMLIRITVSRSEIDMRDIKSRYMELYSQNLVDVINRECRGDYKSLLQAVLDEKQDTSSTKKKDGKATAKTGATVKPAKPFNPMEDSVRLYNAMDGLGTEEDVIVEILAGRTNDQRHEIEAKFQDKYNKDLVSELKSELSGDLEEAVLALMMRPLQYDAHCLHEAVAGLGTNEGVLIGILSTRTGQELAAIKDQYKKAYGKDLQDDITSDVSGDFQDMLVEILKCQREQGDKVDQAMAKEDAKKLYKDGQISIDPKDETFMRILSRRSRAQVRATFEEYKKLTGNDVYRGIEKAFLGDTERGYVGLAKAVEDPVQYYAERLMECFEDFGTKFTRIIIARSEIDLEEIKVRFQSLYSKSIADHVRSECGGDVGKMLLAILGDKTGK